MKTGAAATRALAAANHYPAIDVLASASRVMGAVTTPEHRALVGRVRQLMAKYNEVELLVRIGEYKKGSEPLADEAELASLVFWIGVRMAS